MANEWATTNEFRVSKLSDINHFGCYMALCLHGLVVYEHIHLSLMIMMGLAYLAIRNTIYTDLSRTGIILLLIIQHTSNEECMCIGHSWRFWEHCQFSIAAPTYLRFVAGYALATLPLLIRSKIFDRDLTLNYTAFLNSVLIIFLFCVSNHFSSFFIIVENGLFYFLYYKFVNMSEYKK